MQISVPPTSSHLAFILRQISTGNGRFIASFGSGKVSRKYPELRGPFVHRKSCNPSGRGGGNGVEAGGGGSPLRGEDPSGRRIGVSPDILALSDSRIHRCSVAFMMESPTSRYIIRGIYRFHRDIVSKHSHFLELFFEQEPGYEIRKI